MNITLELPNNELSRDDLVQIFLQVAASLHANKETEQQDDSFLIKTTLGNVFLRESEID